MCLQRSFTRTFLAHQIAGNVSNMTEPDQARKKTAQEEHCFVLMPFGEKKIPGSRAVNFDIVYQTLIQPAIESVELVVHRADNEDDRGIIHKSMFERLVYSEYSVADLTMANPNVFYELGVRHAVRPRSTVLLFCNEFGQLPFDVAMMRVLMYQIDDQGQVVNLAAKLEELRRKLKTAIDATQAKKIDRDSPIFELLGDYCEVAHTKTDVFQHADYSEQVKRELAALGLIKDVEERSRKLKDYERTLEPLEEKEFGVAVALMLAYRDAKAYQEVLELVDQMAPELKRTILVREQQAFCLNRIGKRDEAEAVLRRIIDEDGGSSETYGLLGRIYKDRWEQTHEQSKNLEARGWLDKAVEAYAKGFEKDWRDGYPGVNAVTLMDLKSEVDPRQATMIPVVSYAVERKIASGKSDYWDFATRLELAVLARDFQAAKAAAGDALASNPQSWQKETTLKNLRFILEAREMRGEDVHWLKELMGELS
jgi:tetratricopeptide (TPR) repeat protein